MQKKTGTQRTNRIALVVLISACFFGCEQKPSSSGVNKPPNVGGKGASKKKPNKFEKLAARKMAFDIGSYARGTIPSGEYAFVSKTGGYYSETTNGQILDNENFASFGYVVIHGMGDIKTGGALISLDGLRELGHPGAKSVYEALTDQADYGFSGHYKVGVDIPAGTYIIQSVGSGYVSINKGPVGNEETIDNDNFNGTKTIKVRDGQYLKLSRAKFVRQK